MKNSNNTAAAIKQAIELCDSMRHEFVTPEHVLYALTDQLAFFYALTDIDINIESVQFPLREAFDKMERVPDGISYTIEGSEQFTQMMSFAIKQAQSAEVEMVDVPHIVAAMLMLDDSAAAYTLRGIMGTLQAQFFEALLCYYDGSDTSDELVSEEDELDLDHAPWRQLVTCLNDTYTKHNPLIGRTEELERTIQVLCRKDKNNPLHVGEAGVGKTALVYGLTAMIERGDVPERLKGAKVYMMDMGTMVAGTQFRGDFEKRIKQVMDGLAAEGNTILYIDEIHNLVGAGRNGDSALDASNMLKPYLESGTIPANRHTRTFDRRGGGYTQRLEGQLREVSQRKVRQGMHRARGGAYSQAH